MIYIYGYPKYNYCKEFKLEDEVEEKSFNKRFNKSDNRWVLWSENDLTDMLLRTITRRISDESNIIIVIYGTPNSGKSEIAQTIAKFITYLFLKLRGKNIETHLAFSTAELSTALREMEIGDIAIRDESPKLSGTGAKNVSKNLDNITKITRKNQNSFIFINPTLIKPEVVSLYIEMGGKFKDKRISRGVLSDKNKDEVGHVFVPLHNDENFRKSYLKRKEENIDSLMYYSGLETVELDLERIKKDVKKVYEWCRKIGIYAKNEILGEIAFLNDTLKDKEEVKGDISHIEAVINKTWGEFRRVKRGEGLSWEEEPEEEEPEEDTDEFIEMLRSFEWVNSEKDLLSILRRKRSKSTILERQIKIYKMVRDSTDKDTLDKELKELSLIYGLKDMRQDYYIVRDILKGFKGQTFEKKYETFLKNLKIFDEVIRDGRPGQPDIYCKKDKNLYVFSLKCFSMKGKIRSLKSDDYSAEAGFCHKADFSKIYREVFLYNIVYDTLLDDLWIRKGNYIDPINYLIEMV